MVQYNLRILIQTFIKEQLCCRKLSPCHLQVFKQVSKVYNVTSSSRSRFKLVLCSLLTKLFCSRVLHVHVHIKYYEKNAFVFWAKYFWKRIYRFLYVDHYILLSCRHTCQLNVYCDVIAFSSFCCTDNSTSERFCRIYEFHCVLSCLC